MVENFLTKNIFSSMSSRVTEYACIDGICRKSFHHQTLSLYILQSNIMNYFTSFFRYPVYITKHLAFLPIAEASRWHKAKCLLFLHYMMHLYRLGASALKQKGNILTLY